MSIVLAEEFLKLLDFDLDLSKLNESDCYLAVDDKHLTTYDISQLVKSEARNIYGKDIIDSLYDNLIAKWLVSDTHLVPTQWGIYCKDKELYNTPIQVLHPFEYSNKTTNYTYGSLKATPETMVLIVNDMLYTQKLFRVWSKLKTVYPKFLYLCRNYVDDAVKLAECYNILRNRFYDLNVIFLHSFIRTPEVANFIKVKNKGVYEDILNKNCKDILDIYGEACLSNYIQAYLDSLT